MTRTVIERLGHLGDGVGPGPVFAPRTLPGEVVEGELDGSRISVPRIVTPSDRRIAPACRHYRSCGGCALQHADGGFVAAWKQNIVERALAAQGIAATFRPMAISPPRSRRRATFSGRRTKKGALVGFHAPGSDTITPVLDCNLVTPQLSAALPMLTALTMVGAARKGELALTVTETRTGLDVAVTGGKTLNQTQTAALVTSMAGAGVARLSWDGEIVAQQAEPLVNFAGFDVPMPPGAFLQATVEGEAALRSAMRDCIGASTSVIDLFAGCGTFALPLCESKPVHAVEADGTMLDALDQGWRRAGGLHMLSTERRDLFRNPLLPDELDRFDAIVIDPPRAGAQAQMAQIAKSEVPVIAAISCNPVTFAVDAKMLIQAGYRLDWVQVVDQFRWSPHVELVARLIKDHIAR
ncbi:class I SAM-dependent RNA methyltransferase [Actibacterium sp. 188UL27-1]|uniref:class I SAM-dependent RNA methyltransferase n=1 Tax=Actibacterium sp. 188UL27-1 TaxID=2786961 RepID=UPI00195B4D40|nr:class I SAM-dependent RNA methyltransferase [Actibacterium sp. 188UL27-1]MBM7067303.1 class I SAM-dependent RNA methyltransferase [Actibacterium sp. 188UL27-1]